MLTQLFIFKKNQDVIDKKEMFSIRITHEEKNELTIDQFNMYPKLELWLYKNLELNKKEYLIILANRIGFKSTSKHTKHDLLNILTNWVIFE